MKILTLMLMAATASAGTTSIVGGAPSITISSGMVTATQGGAWFVHGSSIVIQTPNGNTTPIPVSGFPTTVGTASSVRCVNTAGNAFEACGGTGAAGLTDAELRATAVPMSLASVPTHPVTQSGAWTVHGSSVTIAAPNGNTTAIPVSLAATINAAITNATLAVTQSGAWSVAATLAAETTKVIGTVNIAAGQSIATTGTYWQATQPVSLAVAPTTPVTGTFWQAVQAVSQSGAWSIAATLAAETTKIIGTVNIAAGQTIGVTGTFWQATQPVSGTFFQVTQPISAASLPLPADAATQTTLALIKAKTDNLPAQGQALAAGSTPVVLTAAQVTTLTPPAAITGFATETTLGGVKTGTDRIPAQGQALAAASTPVVLTAAQVTTLTPPAAITNFANETGGNLASLVAKDFATQTTLSALNTKVTAVNTGAVTISAPLPTGTNNVGTVHGSSVAVHGVNGVALASESTLSTLNGKVTTVNTGAVVISGALPAGNANIGDVDIVTLPAIPAGANSIGTVVLTAETVKVIGTVNLAAAQTLATVTTVGAVTAITNALPAGTNAIGKLAANAGVTIGAVEIAAAQTLANVTTLGTLTNALPAGANRIGSVRLVDSADADQTSVKGAQTSRFVGVQKAKDVGRVIYVSTATAIAGVTTEAMFNMSVFRDGVSSVAATTFGVTSTKRLVLNQLCVTWRNNTAAAGGVTVRCRMMPTGNTIVSSPIFATLNASTALTTVGSGGTSCSPIPDGLELSGSMTWGCSQIAVGAVVGFDFTAIGYEY